MGIIALISTAIVYLIIGLIRGWFAGKRRSVWRIAPNAIVFSNEAGIHTAALRPRQVNRRQHAAGASATEFNRRQFKRYESRVPAQSFALFPG